jgi:hypothetical protein
MSLVHAYLQKIKSNSASTTIYNLMELLGQLSFNVSAERLSQWKSWLVDAYQLTLIWPVKEVNEKLQEKPESFLPRVYYGKDVFSIVAGAHLFDFDYDEPEGPVEVELISRMACTGGLARADPPLRRDRATLSRIRQTIPHADPRGAARRQDRRQDGDDQDDPQPDGNGRPVVLVIQGGAEHGVPQGVG